MLRAGAGWLVRDTGVCVVEATAMHHGWDKPGNRIIFSFH